MADQIFSVTSEEYKQINLLKKNVNMRHIQKAENKNYKANFDFD